MNLNEWYQRLAGQPQSSEPRGEPPPQVADRLLLSIARSAMACEFEVLLNQFQYPQAADRAVEALDLVQQLENLLSVYKPRSDLSTLNRFGAARQIAMSEDAFQLLQLGQDVHQLTSGAFDLTAGSLSEAWGFSRRQGAIPSEAQIAEALQFVGSQLLQLDAAAKLAWLTRPGVKVNPGGIGKGYALDRAAGRLLSVGIHDFMIHGGQSSVVARGHRQHSATGGGWLVALKHPWRSQETLGTIRLVNAALGTSGSGKQFFHFGGKRYSHIIDPRSGWPAQGMLSTTVICPSGAVADALATGLFVLGPESAMRFCQQHPSLGAILVYSDPQTRKLTIHTSNLTQETWMPLAHDAPPEDFAS